MRFSTVRSLVLHSVLVPLKVAAMPLVTSARLPNHLAEQLIDLRRALHRRPETGLHTPRTQKSILNHLTHLPLEVTTGTGSSAVVATLRGAVSSAATQPRKRVVLRAIMGGLPLSENTQLEYSSLNGVMFANGADLEIATLCGVADMLSRQRHLLAGDVVFAFQAGEAWDSGAASILDDGLLRSSQPTDDRFIGLRFLADAQLGSVVTRSGQQTAASWRFGATFFRYGSPFDSIPVDPMRAAVTVAAALHDYAAPHVSRGRLRLVTQFEESGGELLVQPTQSTLNIGVMCGDETQVEALIQGAKRVICSIAAAENAMVTLDEIARIEAVHNDETMVRQCKNDPTALFDETSAQHDDGLPLLLADDFEELRAESRGLLAWMGASLNQSRGLTLKTQNSSLAVFSDSVLDDSTRLMAQLASNLLHPEA